MVAENSKTTTTKKELEKHETNLECGTKTVL